MFHHSKAVLNLLYTIKNIWKQQIANIRGTSLKFPMNNINKDLLTILSPEIVHETKLHVQLHHREYFDADQCQSQSAECKPTSLI